MTVVTQLWNLLSDTYYGRANCNAKVLSIIVVSIGSDECGLCFIVLYNNRKKAREVDILT